MKASRNLRSRPDVEPGDVILVGDPAGDQLMFELDSVYFHELVGEWAYDGRCYLTTTPTSGFFTTRPWKIHRRSTR